MRRNTLVAVLSVMILAGGALSPAPVKAAQDLDILVACSKPYDSVIAQVQSLNGVVRASYVNIDAIAVTIPSDQLEALMAIPEVLLIEKDHLIQRTEPNVGLEPSTYGDPSQFYAIDGAELSGDVVGFTDAAPAGYYPTEVDLMRASDFWGATGHFGEGVIVGIMDSGTADVPAIFGRVMAGESFLSAYPPIDDGLPANSPLNGSHGTWVATTLGANVIFGFFSSSSFVQAIETYLPGVVLPDYFGPGIDGVPMVGPAPAAEFYPLKIFNTAGSTTNSVILAAFDRAIELKELYDMGDPSGVNLRVINGSFSGATLYAAEDPFFASMIDAVTAAGIVTTFSASNEGPSTMTGRDPGTARNTLTVGATNIAAYERILRDIQYGPGFGALWRANDAHEVSEYSSRGPTSDGRWDPDIVAPGDNIFAQGASGGLNIVNGTSFSAPNVAGAAALLLSANPAYTPDQVRGALLNGANPALLDGNPTREDQGFGFVDLMGAMSASTANPSDVGLESNVVAENIQALGFSLVDEDKFSYSTDWLAPGEGHDVFFEIAQPHTGLSVSVSVEQQNPPGSQNPLFGDSGLIALTRAETHTGRYHVVSLVSSAFSWNVPMSDLDFGVMRMTLAGDDDNAGNVRLHLTVEKDRGSPVAQGKTVVKGKVHQNESLLYSFEMPSGLPEVNLSLWWDGDWGHWPTNDLDVLLIDPTFQIYQLATWRDPERLHLTNPMPGPWLALVIGYTVWDEMGENFRLKSDVKLHMTAAGEGFTAERVLTPLVVSQNSPNPFQGATSISFQLAEGGNVKVEVFDIRGARVRTLLDAWKPAGSHRLGWDATNDAGVRVPAGIYLYKVGAGDQVMNKRMLVLQ